MNEAYAAALGEPCPEFPDNHPRTAQHHEQDHQLIGLHHKKGHDHAAEGEQR